MKYAINNRAREYKRFPQYLATNPPLYDIFKLKYKYFDLKKDWEMKKLLKICIVILVMAQANIFSADTPQQGIGQRLANCTPID